MLTSLSRSQARGALLGHLVGDAVGVPYEFQAASRLPPSATIDMIPPAGFARSHVKVLPGTWSDDGALTLALLHALIEQPCLDVKKAAGYMVDWMRKGKYTPDGRVYDCGITVRMGLAAFECGAPAELSGKDGVSDNGNGALMRAIACLLVPFDSEAALVDRAMRQGVCTHRHLRSQVTCALYSLVCARLAQESLPVAEAVEFAFSELRPLLPSRGVIELDVVRAAQAKRPEGSGYVVDTFWSAIFAVATTSSFKACIQVAVSLGGDTDTTACVAGGIAGLIYGERGIHAPWVEGLRGRDAALHLLEHGEWPL